MAGLELIMKWLSHRYNYGNKYITDELQLVVKSMIPIAFQSQASIHSVARGTKAQRKGKGKGQSEGDGR